MSWFLCVYLYVCLQHKKMECNSIYNFFVYCCISFFCVESILPNHVTIVCVVVGKSHFHHQTIQHHHYHKFMISTFPPKKKLVHKLEVFPFKVDII